MTEKEFYKEYVVIFCEKHITIYYVDDYPFVKFSIEYKYATRFDDYDYAIKLATKLTKKYNLDFHVIEC